MSLLYGVARSMAIAIHLSQRWRLGRESYSSYLPAQVPTTHCSIHWNETAFLFFFWSLIPFPSFSSFPPSSPPSSLVPPLRPGPWFVDKLTVTTLELLITSGTSRV